MSLHTLGTPSEELFLNGKSQFGIADGRFYNIVLYQVVLSCIIGTIIGYAARKALKFAERKE
jgi:NhaP-type Na+/H+ or K+/H+ antiporter